MQINSLREILDESEDEEHESLDSGSQSLDSCGDTSHSPFSFVLCGPSSVILNSPVQHPPKFMINGLCSIYIQLVDPVFNLLHGRSVQDHLQNGRHYLDYRPGHPAVEALDFGVYLSALATQRDDECLQNFGESKASLMTRYRFGLEVALAKADFINTTDITTLQALLLLLVSISGLL